MHVLLIEDSPINRRFISLALSKADIRVTTAENGQIGVETATSGDYDAILMDMQMPVMDGYQATARLRQLDLRIPIIALTGHAAQADREKCERAGCTDHLTKPVDTKELLETLNRTIVEGRCADIRPQDFATDSQDFAPELRQITLDYLKVQRQRIDLMKRSLEQADFEHLAELAHCMKGTAGTVGFPKFTEPAKRLEAAAMSADDQACATTIEELASLQRETEDAISCP
jgi:CheY-like chemotaxis protein/HPt (histidine-containing phosphotransfer) domain-containing protein